MLKKLLIFLLCILSLTVTVSAEEDGIVLDDCADLSKVHNHSDGIYASVIDEDSREAYDEDFTVFMRQELKSEWVEYEINAGQCPTFYAYYRQNEEIAHFTFEQSADGNEWTKTEPTIKITEVESYKWIPVKYTLKSLKTDTKFVRAYFSDKNAVEWSPMLASVGIEYNNDFAGGFADCVGLKCEGAVNKLKNLGFTEGYNKYEYKPENNVTRGEFAKVISKILNTGTSKERVFVDVNSSHWVSPCLAPLYSQGIIGGDENGRFNPEDNITYTDCAKILVSSLGYSVYANDEGGYPYGHIKIAERLNLFDDIDTKDRSMPLARGDMAQMVSNAVEREVLVQTTFGENANFEKRGTLLSEYHNIDKINGVVTSAGIMSLMPDDDTKGGYGVINENVYNMAKYDLSNYLGQRVNAYVDKDENVLYAESDINKIIEIDADDYLYLKDNNIYYDDMQKKAPVDKNTVIVLNGRYYSRIGVVKEFDLNCGSMRLIYNDNGAADTILIDEYKTYIAGADGKLSGVISDRISGKAVKVNDVAEYTDITIYGEKTDFDSTSYTAGDVISIAESGDKKVLKVYISSAYESGMLEYLNTDKKTLRLGGEEYKIANTFKMLKGELKVGSEITVYSDINGQIAAAENSSGVEYAYLINAMPMRNLSGEVKLKLLTADGNIVVLNADDKTYFCGVRNKVDEISSITPQLLKINVEDNNLRKIDTVGTIGFTEAFASDNCKYYGGNMSVFASKYQLSDSTPIFYVPSDTDDSKYKVMNKYGLYSDFNYNIKLFDLAENYSVGAAVVFEDGSRERIVSSYDEVAIIDSVEQIANANGELCLKLSVYIGGENRYIYFDNDGGDDMTDNWIKNHTPRITADGQNPFKCGEAIQYYSDSESHCRSFRMLLTREMIESDGFYEKNTGDYGVLNSENYFSELYTVYGNVSERFSDKLLVSADGVVLRTIPLNGAKIYVYNRARNNLRVGTAADISKNGKVFARMSFADTIDIVVVE